MSAVVIAETVRRHITSAGFLAATAFLAIIGLGVSRFATPGAVWPSVISLLALFVGGGVIGPEFSRGTLQLILTKPVNRSIYLLSRVAGAVLVLWIAIGVATAFEMVGRIAWTSASQLDVLGIRFLNVSIEAVLMCSMLVLFASFTRAYFNVAIYIMLVMGLNVAEGLLAMIRSSRSALGNFLNEHAVIERGLAAINNNLFPEAPMTFDREWTLRVLSNAAIALVIACFAFRRREVPYGAD